MKNINTTLLTQLNLLSNINQVHQELINGINKTFTKDDNDSWIKLTIYLTTSGTIDYYLFISKAKSDLEYRDQCDLLTLVTGHIDKNNSENLYTYLANQLTSVIKEYEIKEKSHDKKNILRNTLIEKAKVLSEKLFDQLYKKKRS